MPGDHCQIEVNYIKEPHKFGIHFAQTHTATIYRPGGHRHIEGIQYSNTIRYTRLRQSSQIMYILVLCDYLKKRFPQYCQIEEAVFWIFDILRRIRILRSVHWITDPAPDSDPALFFSGFRDTNKK